LPPRNAACLCGRPDDVTKIFALYPAVEKLYRLKVPTETTEQAFFEAFFRSEFLHLGRPAGGASGGDGGATDGGSVALGSGLFASVGNADDVPAAASAGEVLSLAAVVDPSVDLVAAYGDYASEPVRPSVRSSDL